MPCEVELEEIDTRHSREKTRQVCYSISLVRNGNFQVDVARTRLIQGTTNEARKEKCFGSRFLRR